MEVLSAIAGCCLNVLSVLLLAPLGEGVLRKITARIQSRQGPPLLQPYFDLLKLLGKEDIEVGESPWLQRLAVYLAFAAVFGLACLLPIGGPAPLGEAADAVLLVYLLTLAGVSTLLAGLAAGSTYSLLGVSREMMTMLALEPLLAVGIVAGAVRTGSLRLDAVLGGSLFAGRLTASGLVLLVVLFLAFPAFVQRVPFDVAEAETEIMEGSFVEYSGPKLALLKWAQMGKLLTYSGLLVGLFNPWQGALPGFLAWPAFWIQVAGLVLVTTLVAATHARYRVDQAVCRFVGLLAAALVALLLGSQGW